MLRYLGGYLNSQEPSIGIFSDAMLSGCYLNSREPSIGMSIDATLSGWLSNQSGTLYWYI